MAVAVIIIATLSIIATVMGTMALVPVIQELGTDSGGHWDDIADPRAVESRDKAFSAIIVLPIFLIGAIVAWAFLAVTRRDFGEV